jgi:hypothetical protein
MAIKIATTRPSVVEAFGKSVSDLGGVRKILKFAIVAIDFFGKLETEIPFQLKELHRNFKECSSTLSFFATLGLVQMWVAEKRSRWQSTAALVNFTALQAINSAKFLEKLELINLSSLSKTIGNIPVLNLAMSLFGLGGSIFTLWDNVREFRDLQDYKLDADQQKRTWSQKRQDIASMQVDGVAKKIDEYFNSEVSQQLLSVNLTEQEKMTYLEKRIDYEVTKYNAKVEDTESKLQKLRGGLVMSVVSLAISILGLAGQCLGIAALSATGLPMLTVAFLMAGYGVYQMFKSNMKDVQKVIDPVESAKNQLMIAARSQDPTLVPVS